MIMILYVALFLFILFVTKSIKLINYGEIAIIERLGRYYKTAKEGLHIIFPFIDHIKARVDLREQSLQTPKHFVVTKDDIILRIDINVFYRITDAKKVVYEVPNLSNELHDLAAKSLNYVISKINFYEIEKSSIKITSEILSILNEEVNKLGCNINRVEVISVTVSKNNTQKIQINFKTSSNKTQIQENDFITESENKNENDPIKEY